MEPCVWLSVISKIFKFDLVSSFDIDWPDLTDREFLIVEVLACNNWLSWTINQGSGSVMPALWMWPNFVPPWTSSSLGSPTSFWAERPMRCKATRTSCLDRAINLFFDMRQSLTVIDSSCPIPRHCSGWRRRRWSASGETFGLLVAEMQWQSKFWMTATTGWVAGFGLRLRTSTASGPRSKLPEPFPCSSSSPGCHQRWSRRTWRSCAPSLTSPTVCKTWCGTSSTVSSLPPKSVSWLVSQHS